MLNLKVPISIFKEGKTYIAYSPVLDLSTSGRTVVLVEKRFAEAVKLFFEELVEMGTLDDVLSSLGWEKVRSKWSPPVPISNEFTNVSIPFSH